MNPFNADLSRVLRYSMDTVANMISQLASDDHKETRWGTGDHIFRSVLADAIQESDRPHRAKEAELLRTEGQHVLIDGDGRVRPAKFTDTAIRNAYHTVHNHVGNWSGGMAPNYTSWENVEGETPADWDDPNELSELDESEHHKPYPKGTVRVQHYDAGDEGYSHPVHIAHLRDHLADSLEHEVDHADYGWNTDGTGTNLSEDMVADTDADFRYLLKQLRKTPYEAIDLGHPTERDNGFGFAVSHNEL